MSNRDLRNLAMQLASQLPKDAQDLYFVLDLMRELSDYWLFQERTLYPQGRVPVTQDYLDERLAEIEARALRGGSSSEFDESNVIKLVGKEEMSSL